MFSLIPYRAYRNSGVKTSTFLKGFTLVEIALAVLIVTILAAITLPVLSRIRMNANETAAAKTIRTLTTAMENWRFANGSYLNPVTRRGVMLIELARANPAYIDKTFDRATRWCPRQGYEFGLAAAIWDPPGPGGRRNKNIYWVAARPVTPDVTGRRYFCATEDGVIKYSNNKKLIEAYSMCKVWALTWAEILE